MSYDRILILVFGIFFIVFAFVTRYIIVGKIRKSNKRTDENKQKEIKKGKIISVFLFLMSIYWIVLFIFYDKLF